MVAGDRENSVWYRGTEGIVCGIGIEGIVCVLLGDRWNIVSYRGTDGIVCYWGTGILCYRGTGKILCGSGGIGMENIVWYWRTEGIVCGVGRQREYCVILGDRVNSVCVLEDRGNIVGQSE